MSANMPKFNDKTELMLVTSKRTNLPTLITVGNDQIIFSFKNLSFTSDGHFLLMHMSPPLLEHATSNYVMWYKLRHVVPIRRFMKNTATPHNICFCFNKN